ncbi:MAG TPA: pitrilysin family protein [Bdellovibrionota bacterium]|jgi:zinc protease
MKKHWKHSRQRFLGSSQLDRFDFENGLRLFVSHNKLAPVFSYQTWFDVGSRDEETGKSGLAHLFEHMMFKGTRKRPQGVFDRSMESAGARDLNAFTSTDYTAYVASLPVKELELVAELESDRMTGLALTKEQFESEREVVQNERKQVMENNPEGQMYEELQKLAFTAHAYGRPVIGFGEDLDRMTTADCEEFYKANYAPDRAVICVSGALAPDKVARAVHKFYGKIAPSRKKAPAPRVEPEQNGERVSVLNLPVQVEKAYFGYRVPEGRHPDQVPLSVLSMALTTGRSSRLYRATVDKGVCIDVGASVNSAKDPSLFYMSFTCQAGKRAEEAVDIIDRELALVAEKGISEEELERVRNKLRTEIHLGLSTNPAVARFVGQHELVLGDVDAAIEEIRRIEKLDASEVKRVAKQYLRREQRCIVIGKPQ